MFFFFPYATDAPIYFFPWATIGLIVANTAFSSFMWHIEARDPLLFNDYILWFGEGFHPVQWLTSFFMHADIGHLLGNMFFFWAFGLLVEGKLGWWKFLLLYLAIGLGESIVTQAVMLDYVASPEQLAFWEMMDLGGSKMGALGASGAIYGVLAVAFLWAPKNDLECFYFFFVFVMFKVGTYSVPILTFGLIYIGLEIFSWMGEGFSMSTPALHLTGGIMGLIAGTVMLKMKLVDCEGWDLFAVMTGKDAATLRTAEYVNRPRGEHVPTAEEQAAAQQRAEKLRAEGVVQIGRYIEQKLYNAAAALHRKLGETGAVPLPAPQSLALIDGLCRTQQWSDAARLMTLFIQDYPQHSIKVRLKLAEVLVRHENRPQAALDTLAAIPAGALTPELAAARAKIEQRAHAMVEEGELELE